MNTKQTKNERYDEMVKFIKSLISEKENVKFKMNQAKNVYENFKFHYDNLDYILTHNLFDKKTTYSIDEVRE